MRQELDANKSKKYNFKDIYNNAVYARKLKGHYLPGIYYLIL